MADFREQLEKHNKPEEVRRKLAEGLYNQQHAKIAQEYLDSKDRESAASASARAEAREDESLSISREALRNSERANKIAISAIVLSIITTIIVAVIQFI